MAYKMLLYRQIDLQGLEGYGPYAGRGDYVGIIFGTDIVVGRRACFCYVLFYKVEFYFLEDDKPLECFIQKAVD